MLSQYNFRDCYDDSNESNYLDNNDNLFETYYNNGVLKEYCKLKNNNKHGEYKRFYNDRSVEIICTYDYGFKNGKYFAK